jgi:hypothetical protein
MYKKVSFTDTIRSENVAFTDIRSSENDIRSSENDIRSFTRKYKSLKNKLFKGLLLSLITFNNLYRKATKLKHLCCISFSGGNR